MRTRASTTRSYGRERTGGSGGARGSGSYHARDVREPQRIAPPRHPPRAGDRRRARRRLDVPRRRRPHVGEARGRRPRLLGRQHLGALRRVDGRRRERLPLLAGVRPDLRHHRPGPTARLHRRVDGLPGRRRVVARPAVAGLAPRAGPAGQPGDPHRQHPPAAGSGHRARLPMGRHLVVRAADQGDAGRRPRLVRGPPRVDRPRDGHRGDRPDRRRLVRDRPAAVARLDHPPRRTTVDPRRAGSCRGSRSPA